MTNLESVCDNFYNGFAGLPRTDSQNFSLWWGGSSYNLLKEKSNKSRKEMWDNLSAKYYSPYQPLALSDSRIKIKYRNTFFHSYAEMEITDENNNHIKAIAYTPWYSAIYRAFFAKDLVITKIKKNYTPLSKKLKKNYDSFASTVRENYPLFAAQVKEDYHSFVSSLKEDYIPFIKKTSKFFADTLKKGYMSLKKKRKSGH